MTSGVYKITNTLTGKCYIGATRNVESRFSSHISQLNRGKHCCKPLQEEWSIYGREAFDFCVLQELEKEELYVTEKYYIKEYSSLGECYNQRKGAYHRTPKDSPKTVVVSLSMPEDVWSEISEQAAEWRASRSATLLRIFQEWKEIQPQFTY
jgi:group I intron endonuclease